jgi:hypothetical protein
VSASVVQQNSTLSTPFETGDLTPPQVQVVVALAQGCSTIRAAAAAGVHRTTIYHWMRASDEFRAAVDQARAHFAACLADQLDRLSATALGTLEKLLTDSQTSPAVRLNAALAVLERSGTGWQLPRPGGLIALPGCGNGQSSPPDRATR